MERKNLTIKENFNLAIQYYKKNNIKFAEKICKKILTIDPNHFDSILLLGLIFASYKNFIKSKELLHKALEIKPNHSSAHNNLAAVLNELKEHEKAKIHFDKAIEINPNNARVHNNLGAFLIALGKNHEALKSYKNAILINPNLTLAVNNLSKILREIRLDNIQDIEIGNLKEILLLLLRRDDIYHQDIFFYSRLILFQSNNINKDQITKIINLNGQLLKNLTIQNLIQDELFLLLLQKCLITDHFLEKILTKIRYEVLFIVNEHSRYILKENLNFIISLAKQCFLNEYVFSQSRKETNFIKQLQNSVEKNRKINELEIIILSSYVPLHSSYIITKKLLNYHSNNSLFNDLITMQIKEPLKEKKIAYSIKSLGKVTDEISKKVMIQYEQHPYPRWRYIYKNLHSISSNIIKDQIKPNEVEFDEKFIKPNVLIAGCGTGRHLFKAADYLNANILGVDLSITSLTYAKRKIDELNLKNIKLLNADILQLKNLNKKFNIIECVGTLHHMRDPLQGLKILQDLLEPKGLLQLGLYSEIGRQDVIKVRKFINEKNFKSTNNDIRNCREAILKKRDEQLFKKILYRKDFYSISSVRDLIFHVQEHRFTLIQISKILNDLNLEFLGFVDSSAKKKYSYFFPEDKKNISLKKWNIFEIDNPDTFTGMYIFWVKKK